MDRAQAFTRGELLVVLGTVTLLAGLTFSALGQSRSRSLQAVCVSNLQSVGQALGLFNADNGGFGPWRTLASTSPLRNNAWFHYALLSNYVSSPLVFACPSDASARPARDFTTAFDGGFLNPNYMNNAVSYMIGLDSSNLLPGSVMAADRNLRCPGGFGSCSTGINPALTIYLNSQVASGWNAGLHGRAGNLLLHDGRVEATSNESVNRHFMGTDDAGVQHFLSPRN